MAYVPPTVADFKSRFIRDFPFCGQDQTDLARVRDADVTLALAQAGMNFSQTLWDNQAGYSQGYLLLAAHYLVTNLAASSQGIGGAGQWLTAGKSAGGLSETYQIPERVMKSPVLSLYSKTTYGCEFLSLVAVRLVGAVYGAPRGCAA